MFPVKKNEFFVKKARNKGTWKKEKTEEQATQQGFAFVFGLAESRCILPYKIERNESPEH
jgi:hypothetical protein